MTTGSFKLKMIITGDPLVGKTSLRRTYLGKSFSSNYLPTISADFSSRIIALDDLHIDIGLWDIAGHQKFTNLINAYFSHTQAAIIVCDITQPETMDNCMNWIHRILGNNKEYNEIIRLPLLIIANKRDLRSSAGNDDENITENQFTQFVDSLESIFNNIIVIHGETSAKSGHNVKKLFSKLIEVTIAEVMKQVNFEEQEQVMVLLKRWRFHENYKVVDIVSCINCGKKYQKTRKLPSICDYCDGKITAKMIEQIFLHDNTVISH